MLKSRLLKIVIILVVIVCGGYIAYDNYFELPVSNPSGSNAEDNEERADFDKFNVLILGVDGRKGVNHRTDTIMLASIDGETKKAQLLSIPRDTRVKIKGAWDKVNAAYAYGGVDLTKETIAEFLDVEIHRYAIIDFNSLVKVVDEIGGIEVDVPVRMYVPLEGIDLKPGLQELDGEQVLAYSRFRNTSEGDIGRAKRQQQVVQLIIDKVMANKDISQISSLASTMKEEIKTDLSVKDVISIARIAPDIMENGISSQVLPGKNKKIDGLWFWEPNLSELDLVIDITDKTSVASAPESTRKS